MKSSSLCADSKGLIIVEWKDDNKVLRRALPLPSAGEEVQETFETLTDTYTGEIKDYDKEVKALNGSFIPKINSTCQHHIFRWSMEQRDGETEAQFAARLGNWLQIVIMHGEQAENRIGYQVPALYSSWRPFWKEVSVMRSLRNIRWYSLGDIYRFSCPKFKTIEVSPMDLIQVKTREHFTVVTEIIKVDWIIDTDIMYNAYFVLGSNLRLDHLKSKQLGPCYRKTHLHHYLLKRSKLLTKSSA